MAEISEPKPARFEWFFREVATNRRIIVLADTLHAAEALVAKAAAGEVCKLEGGFALEPTSCDPPKNEVQHVRDSAKF